MSLPHDWKSRERGDEATKPPTAEVPAAPTDMCPVYAPDAHCSCYYAGSGKCCGCKKENPNPTNNEVMPASTRSDDDIAGNIVTGAIVADMLSDNSPNQTPDRTADDTPAFAGFDGGESGGAGATGDYDAPDTSTDDSSSSTDDSTPDSGSDDTSDSSSGDS